MREYLKFSILKGANKWAAVYFIVLLVFPFLYLSFGAEFKHGNLDVEHDFIKLRGEINKLVENGVSKATKHGSNATNVDTLAVTTNPVITAGSLEYIVLITRPDSSGASQYFNINCSIPFNAWVLRGEHNSHFMTCGISEGQSFGGFRKPNVSNEVFPPVYFGQADTEKLSKYFKAISGDASLLGFKDNFFRMTYFSVVTITTLGYGDITPINSVARFLVALESVLGIVIMGLFLSSIATRAKVRDRV